MSTCYFQKNLNYGKLRCISKVQDGEKQGKQSEILNREIKYKKENDTTESEKKNVDFIGNGLEGGFRTP